MQCIQLLEDELQITMPIDEAGFLTMFFVVDQFLPHKQK